VFAPSLVKFDPHIPENNPEKMPHSLELDGANVLNDQLENVAIANALQLEAARRRAVPIRFNIVARANLKSISLSVAVLERFYCLYVRLRCDLEF